MSEIFCDHCVGEVEVPADWPHGCCPKCKADGHSQELTGECPVCVESFSNKMDEIERQIDERVIREGLTCVDTGGSPNLQAWKHYKVLQVGTTGMGWDLKYWVRVVDDSGEPSEHSAGCFRTAEHLQEAERIAKLVEARRGREDGGEWAERLAKESAEFND